MFIIVDGIDGSGKGTIVQCLERLLSDQGKSILDARVIMREERRFPTRDERDRADVIITGEPTYLGVGAVIREELVRDPSYHPRTVAAAFAVDREIHYRRLVIPALAEGKTVISERGVATSLAYQVSAGVPESEILSLPGNALALEHAPDILIIAAVDAQTAIERLRARTGKTDDSYYERQAFLEAQVRRYGESAFRAIFTKHGTRVVELSTAGTVADTERRCRDELLPLLAD